MILILHGWKGSDPGHWQHHLLAQLQVHGVSASLPDLPRKDAPDLAQWLAELDRILRNNSVTGVVCHSLANLLWLHYCHQYQPTSIPQLLLVAPCSWNKTITEAKTFFQIPADAPKCVAASAQRVQLVMSKNDPYCPLDDARHIEQSLAVPTMWIHNAGHINTDAGYGNWEYPLKWLLDGIH